MLFLTTLCLLGYCFAFTRVTRWPVESTPFFVVSLLISLLYGFAYFGYLHIGAVILLGLGAGFLLLTPLYIKREERYKKYLTPGFVVLFLFTAIFAAVASHSHLYLWDEFTQWAAHAKFIAQTHAFWTANNQVIHPAYPPGAALFYYLFYPFDGYRTGGAYFAQQMLLLLPLGVILRNSAWPNWQRPLLIMAIAAACMMLLHVHMGAKITLYLDGLVGVYFGISLLCARESAGSLKDVLYFAPVVFAMMLLKVKLLGFVLLVLFFLLVGSRSVSLTKKIFTVLLLVLIALVASWSWQYYSIIHGLNTEWRIHASFLQVTRTFMLFDFTAMQKVTALHFLKACLKLLPYVFVILTVAFCHMLCLQVRVDRRSILVDQLWLLLGFTGFLTSLLLMYLFAFSGYEASQLASFSRYTQIYLVGWFLFTYARFSPALSALSFAWGKRVSTGLTALVLVILPVFLIASHAARVHKDKEARSLWHTQKVLSRIVDKMSTQVPSNAKVFTVWQDSTGLERAILAYKLIPRRLNLGASSYGSPYFSGDVWTKTISADQFVKRVSSYDYLLLAYTDKNFWQHYGSVFEKNVRTRPFVEYLICTTPEFNGFRKPGCSMQAAAAYLFKVEKKNGTVVFRSLS